MGTRYLVTGGAGFIGSHIAERLLEQGALVRIFDNFATGKRATVAGLTERFGGALELHEGDLADADACRRAVEDCAYIFHEAALASVPRSIADPLGTHRANVTGTLHLLLAARDAGVRRLVYAGSSSVYGDSPELPKRETLPAAPLSPYALSKFVGEEYARLFGEQFGLETVTLRYFNVFGPRQDPDSPYAAVIPIFLKRLRAGEAPVIHGDGAQTRDFTFVANVVAANLAACHEPRAAGVYNIACGERTSVNELLALLQRALGTDIPARFEGRRAGDVPHSVADISRARAELGYAPGVTLAEGISRTVDHFRELPL
ncbi:MAG: SDR family oxidoreductase [Candidatus Eisenbacteria bacterium]|uniref:SDR family oxidoreductase n=1 Tax=Eiseniibacteriota bacterium TaxID=2212470 RepID=A0A938BRB0_UNCEI|nr:SDR family oxidoreductase [Candidatus Eisenbacteria bacterium]